MDKERLALIDLDTLVFIIAYKQFETGNRDNEEAVRTHVREFLSYILVNTRADKVSMVYQSRLHENYRKFFYPSYKEKRPTESPEFMLYWRDTILTEFENLEAIGIKVIESDDVLAIGYELYKDEYDIILVHSDKDINQVQGEHYNPLKHISYTITKEEAIINLYIQVLAGDATDSITGIDGIGAKWNYTTNKFDAPKALKILNDTNFTIDIPLKIYKAYESKFEGQWYSEYLKTRFLVELITYEKWKVLKELYPYYNEVSELFNIKSCSDFTVTNIFS